MESAYAKFLITHIICAPVVAGIFLALAEVDVYDSLPIWRTIYFVLDPHIALCHTLAKFSIKIIANHNWDIMPAEKKRFLCAEESVRNPCCGMYTGEFLRNIRNIINYFQLLKVWNVLTLNLTSILKCFTLRARLSSCT